MEEKKKGINFKKFFLNIILPTLLSIMLFIVLIFWYIIPYFENNLLISRKDMIRELVNSTKSIANKNYLDFKAGMITEEQAKKDAIDKIRFLRYGIEQKDYFFITDMHPNMIMHPYRFDLNGKDLTNLKDPNGKALFVEMVENIRKSGDGFVDYQWQWMDESSKIVPKISYVSEFKPWGWVIGTGIYIEDVREKIAEIEKELIIVSLAISGIIALLLTVIVFQNFKTEKKRSIAEKELLVSKEKYKTLVEASTEGTAMILDRELIYSNKLFDDLFEGMNLTRFSSNLQEFFFPENIDVINRIKSFIDGDSGYLQMETSIKSRNNQAETVLLSLSKIKLNDKEGLIVIIKDLTGETLSINEKSKWSKQMVDLLDSLKSAMFKVSLTDDGRFVDCNEHTLNILKFPSQKDLLKINISDILESRHEGLVLISTIRTLGFVSDYRLKARSYDSKLLVLQLDARYEKDDLSQKEYITGTFKDVTTEAENEKVKEQTYGDIHSSLLHLNRELKHFQKETISCNLKLSAGKAAGLMARYNSSLLLVRSDDGIPLGVITDTDVRSRMISHCNMMEMPVSEFMSSPVYSLPETASLSDAIVMMEDKNIHHLIVKNSSNEVSGYIGMDEIMGNQQSTSHILIAAIKHSNSLPELKNIYSRLPYFVSSSIEGSINSEFVLRNIAEVADNISRKIAELIFLEIGEAPVPFAFVSLGSEGRGEQTLTSDQDNALIYDDSIPEKLEEAKSYFARFAERMNYMLDAVGYAYCTGEVMARNPKWNQPLSKWKSYFREWISHPEPQNLLEIAVFFDMKLTFGSRILLDELQGSIFNELNRNNAFFGFLARVGTSYKTQLSIFGRIQTESTDEHSKSVNIKNPIRVIVHLVRLYAMKNNLTETNTLKRLKILYEKNVFSESFYKEIVYSYDFLTLLQLKSQVISIKSHSKQVNFVDITALSSLELNLLKNVFSQISTFQSKLKYDFGLAE